MKGKDEEKSKVERIFTLSTFPFPLYSFTYFLSPLIAFLNSPSAQKFS